MGGRQRCSWEAKRRGGVLRGQAINSSRERCKIAAAQAGVRRDRRHRSPWTVRETRPSSRSDAAKGWQRKARSEESRHNHIHPNRTIAPHVNGADCTIPQQNPRPSYCVFCLHRSGRCCRRATPQEGRGSRPCVCADVWRSLVVVVDAVRVLLRTACVLWVAWRGSGAPRNEGTRGSMEFAPRERSAAASASHCCAVHAPPNAEQTAALRGRHRPDIVVLRRHLPSGSPLRLL